MKKILILAITAVLLCGCGEAVKQAVDKKENCFFKTFFCSETK